jgi:hypothetical protein
LGQIVEDGYIFVGAEYLQIFSRDILSSRNRYNVWPERAWMYARFLQSKELRNHLRSGSQRRSSAWVLRTSNLLDSEFARAIFELEQDDVRGVWYDGSIRPEEVLGERMSNRS